MLMVKNRVFPLVYQYKHEQNAYIPSITLHMVCDFLEVPPENIEIRFGRFILLREAVFPGGGKKNIYIPIDKKGCVSINWVGSWKDSFSLFSVSDFWKNTNKADKSDQLKQAFDSALVIFSDITHMNKDFGTGIFDRIYPLSSIHATVANMILTDNFIINLRHWQNLIFHCVFIIMFYFLSLKFNNYRFLITAIILMFLFVLQYVLFFLIFNILSNPVTFLSAFVLSLFSVFTYKLFSEEKKKFILLSREKTAREKKQYAYYLSHEFKIPLTLILGNLDLLYQKNRIEISKKAFDRINAIRTDTHELYKLLCQFFDLVQMDAGNMKLCVYKVNLCDLLKYILSSFALYTADKKIQFDFKTDNKPVYIYLDPDKIYVSIIILLLNSLKFTPIKSQITIRIELKNDNKKQKKVILKIKDSGPCIAEKDLGYLFANSNLVSAGSIRIHRNEGFKIYMAKEIIEIHGGTFCIINTGMSGLEFNLEFISGKAKIFADNIIKEDKIDNKTIKQIISNSVLKSHFLNHYPEHSFQQNYQIENTTDQIKMALILIAEHDQRMSNYIRELLEDKYSVIFTASGDEILRKLKKVQPDLIICEDTLPDMNGLTLLEKIYIKEVLKKTNGNLTMAASHLGMHVSSLSRRIKKLKN